jgi:hypothetical protein
LPGRRALPWVVARLRPLIAGFIAAVFVSWRLPFGHDESRNQHDRFGHARTSEAGTGASTAELREAAIEQEAIERSRPTL